MDNTISRRPIAAVVSLAAAITLTVGATAPTTTSLHVSTAPRAVAAAVALTANPLEQIWEVFTGADTTYPLPVGANPVAPITEQVLRSVTTCSGQLLAGQGHLIPGEISAQLKNLQDALPAVQTLLVDDVAVIPAVAFSAFFMTALVIGSLPASASALPGLVDIWLRAVFFPPLKWVYNGFAIRNVIATALQPEPATAAAASTAPAQRTASSGRSTTAKAAPRTVTPPAKRTAAPSKRSAAPTAAGSATPRAKSGVAGSQRHRQNAPSA